MNKTEFLNIIEERIDKHHLLNHSFYKAWNAGELDRSVIQEYSAQYFKHVSAFPRYLSSIHSNCDDISVRQEILENLIDEERGDENHPELWMRFAEGMGIREIRLDYEKNSVVFDLEPSFEHMLQTVASWKQTDPHTWLANQLMEYLLTTQEKQKLN